MICWQIQYNALICKLDHPRQMTLRMLLHYIPLIVKHRVTFYENDNGIKNHFHQSSSIKSAISPQTIHPSRKQGRVGWTKRRAWSLEKLLSRGTPPGG